MTKAINHLSSMKMASNRSGTSTNSARESFALRAIPWEPAGIGCALRGLAQGLTCVIHILNSLLLTHSPECESALVMTASTLCTRVISLESA